MNANLLNATQSITELIYLTSNSDKYDKHKTITIIGRMTNVCGSVDENLQAGRAKNFEGVFSFKPPLKLISRNLGIIALLKRQKYCPPRFQRLC